MPTKYRASTGTVTKTLGTTIFVKFISFKGNFQCKYLVRVINAILRQRSLAFQDPKSAKFIFNVVEFPIQDGRTYERKGVATGELYRIFQKMNNKSTGSDSTGGNFSVSVVFFVIQLVNKQFNNFHFQLSVFLRTNNGFSLPESTEIPLILVGPGTGVAPFLGFLSHREELVKNEPSLPCGPVWLFYGCRNRDQDYLFKYVSGRLLILAWQSLNVCSCHAQDRVRKMAFYRDTYKIARQFFQRG